MESLKGKKFIVTGGAGFIGSHIVDLLISRGASVIIVDDLSNGKVSNIPACSMVEFIRGDITSFDFSSVGKVDCVFNQAATSLILSFKDPYRDMKVNAAGTLRVLDYCRRYDVRIVHASSGSVYGNPQRIPIDEKHPLLPISPYGVSKLASEHYCLIYSREYGVDVRILRYFNVYGPRQNVSEEMGVIPIFVKNALSNMPIKIFGDGNQTRDFLNVKDVAMANLLAYISETAKGEIMNIGGGGYEISIFELARKIKKICMSQSEIIFAERKPGDISRLVADSSKAEKLIGYKPSVDLDTGLREYVEYAKN
jgi:UDP-glucose 4-epimerase